MADGEDHLALNPSGEARPPHRWWTVPRRRGESAIICSYPDSSSGMVHEAIAQFFADYDLAPTHVVAACSGGADSTALVLALRDVLPHGALTVAHVNHHLRGAESDGDEAFLRELCERLDVPLKVADGTLDDEAIKHRGIEAAAREIRHTRLHEIRSELSA